MKPLVRVIVLTSALVCSAPLLAQELSTSAVKAFIARIDAASERRDIDTILRHVAELCIFSGTVNLQGEVRVIRLNKAQYGQLLTRSMGVTSSYTNERSNEKISIDGDQAVVTADVVETMVIEGQTFATKTRERATVENIDGTLMLTQLVSNVIM